MHIVDVAEFYAEKGGGVKTYCHQKLEVAAKLGHQVTIIAPGPEDKREERLGGHIQWIKGPPMPLDPRYYVLWNEKKVHQVLDELQPDVLEGSSPWTGGVFASRWKGKAKKSFIFHQDPVAVYPKTLLGPLIGSQRVDRLFGPYWLYLRQLAKRYDHTVVASEWLAERLKDQGIANATPVPFGISKERFSPSLRSEELRKDWLKKCQQDEDATLMVGISRHHPEKRIGTMIRAVKEVSKTKKVGFVLFGDGPLHAYVKHLAKSAPHIHIAGFTSDRELVSKTLASSDLFLHGSAAETYGLVIAEALSSGLPLVVPSAGGAFDLAGAEYAETYTPGDAKACADAILRLLERPKQVLRQHAYERSQKIGTMEDHFRQLFELYSQTPR